MIGVICNLLLLGCCRLLWLDLGRAALSSRGTTFGFGANGPQPFGLEAPGSVEPLGSEVPWKAQWKFGGLDAARRKGSPPANERR